MVLEDVDKKEDWLNDDKENDAGDHNAGGITLPDTDVEPDNDEDTDTIPETMELEGIQIKAFKGPPAIPRAKGGSGGTKLCLAKKDQAKRKRQEAKANKAARDKARRIKTSSDEESESESESESDESEILPLARTAAARPKKPAAKKPAAKEPTAPRAPMKQGARLAAPEHNLTSRHMHRPSPRACGRHHLLEDQASTAGEGQPAHRDAASRPTTHQGQRWRAFRDCSSRALAGNFMCGLVRKDHVRSQGQWDGHGQVP